MKGFSDKDTQLLLILALAGIGVYALNKIIGVGKSTAKAGASAVNYAANDVGLSAVDYQSVVDPSGNKLGHVWNTELDSAGDAYIAANGIWYKLDTNSGGFVTAFTAYPTNTPTTSPLP